MTQQAMELIDALAQRFGTTAAFLIEEMARYYIATTGAAFIIFTVLTVMGAMFAVWLLKVRARKEHDPADHDDTSGYIIGAFLTAFFTVGFLVIALCSAVDLVGWIASPTAGVIEKIIRMLRG